MHRCDYDIVTMLTKTVGGKPVHGSVGSLLADVFKVQTNTPPGHNACSA